jgi:hypothetical protein
MQAMKEAYESEGLAIVAVNLDENRADAARFLAQYHPSFEVRYDPNGEIAQHYRVEDMPTSLITDRHGAVRFTHIGFRPVDEDACGNHLHEISTEK